MLRDRVRERFVSKFLTATLGASFAFFVVTGSTVQASARVKLRWYFHWNTTHQTYERLLAEPDEPATDDDEPTANDAEGSKPVIKDGSTPAGSGPPPQPVTGESGSKNTLTEAFCNMIEDAPRRQRCLDDVAAIAAGKFGSATPPSPVPKVGAPAAPALSSGGGGLKTMDAIDFLVDAKSLVGQRVTITACQIRQADTLSVYCGTKAGNIELDPETMDRESLRHAFKDCTAVTTGLRCFGDVTGTVGSRNGRVWVLDSSIRWR